MSLSRTALAGLCLSLSATLLPAQVEHGGRPPSQLRVLRTQVPTARMRPVRADLLLAEDEAVSAHPHEPVNKPLRFADVLAVDLDLAHSGAWEELAGGARVWRLRIHSPGAKSLALVFRRFQLPEGGELYVYDDQKKSVRGAYTLHENRLDGAFAMRPLRGDALTLEYFEPAHARGLGELALAAVAHDYRGVVDYHEPEDRTGGGGTGTCNVDVACPLGAPWASQINACVKVMELSHGTFCSGSLLNNTAGDGTLLVLSAAHCGDISMAAFFFNFERPGCAMGTPPMTNTLMGSTLLVSDPTADVQLVRLDAPQAPLAFPAFLSGWDRSDVVPASSVVIHHPGGDEKKISLDDDAPVQVGNFWRIIDWERGVTAGGSSGAPMFDPAGRFIGNLDSGSSFCQVPMNDFCTRLAVAWPLLEPYLDPRGTGQLTLDGLDLALVTPQPFDVTGLFPAEVATLEPGPWRTLRILGTGFKDTTEVLINGIPLPSSHFVRGGHSFLNVDMPPFPRGRFRLGAREGGVSESFPLRVVGVTEPRLQVGRGTPGELVFSFLGLDTYLADVPGHVHYCFWSLSNTPSFHPLLSLGIGNNFTDISYCEINPIPAQGFLREHLDIPFGRLPFGTIVYNQSACVSHGSPFATSNLQETLFQF